MRRRCLHLYLLVLLFPGIASAPSGETLHGWTGADERHHSEGDPCPDPVDDGHPCGPTCPCTCCPGHLTKIAIAPVRPVIAARPDSEVEAVLPTALHPKEIINRIFHPPRA
ncbi:MAG TPA: hypothetical protein VM285_17220 [Polyangia bacterium]|nr:hypothetical protein [Polyangia bacterium]